MLIEMCKDLREKRARPGPPRAHRFSITNCLIRSSGTSSWRTHSGFLEPGAWHRYSRTWSLPRTSVTLLNLEFCATGGGGGVGGEAHWAWLTTAARSWPDTNAKPPTLAMPSLPSIFLDLAAFGLLSIIDAHLAQTYEWASRLSRWWKYPTRRCRKAWPAATLRCSESLENRFMSTPHLQEVLAVEMKYHAIRVVELIGVSLLLAPLA